MTAEATLSIEVTCGHCRVRSTPGMIFLEMDAGPSDTPWYLCTRCWFDGLHPNDPTGIGARTEDAAARPKRKDRQERSPSPPK